MTEDDETLRTLDVNNEDEWAPNNDSAHRNASADLWSLRSDSVYRADDFVASYAPSSSPEAVSHFQLGMDGSLFDNTLMGSTRAPSSSDAASATTVLHQLYIQTEFCDLDLRAHISGKSRIADSAEIWRIFRQIIEGLAHIHSQGIVHRDLKPSNIFIRPEGMCVGANVSSSLMESQYALSMSGDVRIGDLGLAIQPLSAPLASDVVEALDDMSLEPNELDLHTTRVGTFLYMSPEQLLGASKGLSRFQYDEKVDIYSLGIILFELA